MRRLQVAIIGLGRVGRACADVIVTSLDLALAGIVRRPESLRSPVPPQLAGVPVVPDVSELRHLDAAIICVPAPRALETATDLLQHRIPIIEAALVPAATSRERHQEIHRVACRHRVAAVVGAGWNPGVLPLLCELLAVVAPKGVTQMRDRPGTSLHHTLAARSIVGVKNALSTEYRTVSGGVQRYVYVELDDGADADRVFAAIGSDPLFLGEDTIVLPVDSIAALEDEGHGCVVERNGSAGGKAHQRLLFEARIDRVAVTAQTMVAAARALQALAPGAHSLSDVPPSALTARQPLGEHQG